jgi:hypothetical protein
MKSTDKIASAYRYLHILRQKRWISENCESEGPVVLGSFLSTFIPKTSGYCWRTLKSGKFHRVYGFFEDKELGKSRAESSALGIEIGSPTVSPRFWNSAIDGFNNYWM